MSLDDTICAVATPPGCAAIAVVRLSGPKALAFASRIFAPGTTGKPSPDAQFKSHVARHGFIVNPDSGEVVDEVVVTAFFKPKSYTGEDLVEISCHGGYLTTSQILSLSVALGCRLAERGEFTKRAFLNGRLDLTQAEAVIDLIQARTGRQGKMALSALGGHLGARIASVRNGLLELLTRIVAGIDFPEEIGDAPYPDVAGVVDKAEAELAELAMTARSGRFLREGLRLAIAGRPNAGKSSLLNQLLKFERAIVTEIPGTTRDALEELLDLNGIPVILVDTAGIRHTEDAVEKIGIERTRAAIAASDLVLVVVDLTQGWAQAEEEILTLVDRGPFLIVANKCDLAPAREIGPVDKADGRCLGVIATSALTGAGLDDLTTTIERWVLSDQSAREGEALLNSRQAALCARARQALSLVKEAVDKRLPQDCLATDLKEAIDALSEIAGQAVSEEVIDNVFARFCIGK